MSDIAKIIKAMSPTDYETAVWDAHLKSIEIDRPQAFADDEQDLGDSYEEGYHNKN